MPQTLTFPAYRAEITLSVSDFTLVSSIRKAVELLRGVDKVSVRENYQATKIDATSDLDFIRSLHAVGGRNVPLDENPTDALVEAKYL